MIRAFLCLLVLGGVVFAQEQDLNDLSAGIALGGPDILAIIKTATKVTAQRIDASPEASSAQEEPHPLIVTLGEPFVVPSPEDAALKHVFTQGRTYVSPSKSCQFRPNVRYTFSGGTGSLQIILCFGCGELEVWQGDKLVSFGPFDGGYGDMLAVTKRLFPKDAFIGHFTEDAFHERAARMQVTPPPASVNQ